MNPNKVLVGGIVIAIVLSVAAFFRSGPQGLQGPRGEDGQYGAVPVLESPLEVNGTREYRISVPMRTATTTLCSIRTPNATSTGWISARFVSAAIFSTSYEIGNGATAQATTTSLATFTIPASSNGYSVAGTSSVAAYGPNTYLNVNLSTSSASSGFAPVGRCNSFLRVI